MNERPTNPWPALLVVCLGFFMIMLDTTIVYIATPSILTSLQTSLDSVLWVFNGYLLAYAVLLITAGRLGDLFGPRNLFAAGLVLFTAASALCGLSQDATQLIVARVVQGVGGALLAPQSLAILTSIFPRERMGAALGFWGAVIGVSTIAGPTIGGLIITNFDWRWIFFVNVPIGVVALLGAFLIVPDVRPGRAHRFDVVGVGLSGAPMSLVSMFVAPFSGRLVDRFGGKYFLMAGLLLFASGTGLVFAFASLESGWQTFIAPLMLAGLGMGCVFAPMTTVAMRDVAMRDTGAASGVFNTMRQLGAVIGSAVIGAVLQAQLAVDLPAEATSASTQLPPQFRDQFISGFAQAARAGFQVGVGQAGGAQLPPNLPAQAIALIQTLARQVFERGFIDAMHPTAVVAVAVLIVAAAGCIFIDSGRRVRVSEPVLAVAGD